MRQDFEAPEILWEMATIIIWIAAFILPLHISILQILQKRQSTTHMNPGTCTKKEHNSFFKCCFLFSAW